MKVVSLVLILVLCVLTAPVAAQGQPGGKIVRVGWLRAEEAGPSTVFLGYFRDGLRERGWVEGRNIIIEQRSFPAERGTPADRRLAHASRLADLVSLQIDVIFASPAAAAIGARRASLNVPVVFTGVSDPIAFGLVASLPRPGGNVTGISFQAADLNPKRLELLKEAVPGAARIGALVGRSHPLRERMVRELEVAAAALRVELRVVITEAFDPNEVDRAFETLAKEHASAVIGLPVAFYYQQRSRIAALAIRHRLPTIFELPDFAEAGCLMGYGPTPKEMWRLGAGVVDKILRGANPADIPVQQPTKFELVINMRTAKALGLTIPPSLLLRADQVTVIE